MPTAHPRMRRGGLGPGRRTGSSRMAGSWALLGECEQARRAGGRDKVLVDIDFLQGNRTRASSLESETEVAESTGGERSLETGSA